MFRKLATAWSEGDLARDEAQKMSRAQIGGICLSPV